MDIQRAKELLAVLSDGVNPLTGEVLPEDDSCGIWTINLKGQANHRPTMPESPGQRKMKRLFLVCLSKAAPKKRFAATSSVRPEQLRRDL